MGMVPLSVLDLATIGKGFTPAEALAGTTRLAGVVEQLGLPADVGGRAPRDAGGGQLGPGRAHRAPG